MKFDNVRCKLSPKLKKLKKSLQKVLTKGGDGDIIYKLSRRAVLRKLRLKRAGSLKIEQQASYKSTKVDVYRDSEILLKNI